MANKRAGARPETVDPVVSAVAAMVRPALTPIPVDDWVLRGRAELANELARPAPPMADATPSELTSLLELVERTVTDRQGTQAWTATSQALPEPGSMVLGWHRQLHHMVLEYAPDSDPAVPGIWFTQDCECIAADDVLAWRPLPPAFHEPT